MFSPTSYKKFETETLSKIQDEASNDITEVNKKEIASYVEQMVNLVKSNELLKVANTIADIERGKIKTELTAADLPLVEDKHGIKSVYHSLFDEGLTIAANDFGDMCHCLGYVSDFHYEF